MLNRVRRFERPRLTILGRSAALIAAELLANVACWVAAGVLFGRDKERRGILSLALVAWTLGLRHGLDSDHISAIDNATRSLISLGQLPVTCGLFFSLGHSTIVLVVTVAIAISTDVYKHLGGVGEVGGIIGAAISSSFLFILGVSNSIMLHRSIRARRKIPAEQKRSVATGYGAATPQDATEPKDNTPPAPTLLMKIIGPLLRFVDRPWKMYPVGILFGFGFDTASSIALLGISAIAARDSKGHGIYPAEILVLPLLFTSGMSFVDSADSILMLYAYAEPSTRSEQGRIALFRPKRGDNLAPVEEAASAEIAVGAAEPLSDRMSVDSKDADVAVAPAEPQGSATVEEGDAERKKKVLTPMTTSNLSIVLTLISIVVALAISVIQIMGLIGENCARCTRAAEAEEGGGLEGSWWRFWVAANDNSGSIGAAIVGLFVVILAVYYGFRKMRQSRRSPVLL